MWTENGISRVLANISMLPKKAICQIWPPPLIIFKSRQQKAIGQTWPPLPAKLCQMLWKWKMNALPTRGKPQITSKLGIRGRGRVVAFRTALPTIRTTWPWRAGRVGRTGQAAGRAGRAILQGGAPKPKACGSGGASGGGSGRPDGPGGGSVGRAPKPKACWGLATRPTDPSHYRKPKFPICQFKTIRNE
jgi:hypothetical protein